MKRAFPFLCTLLLLTPPVSAETEEPKFYFGLDGGFAYAQGDGRDFWRDGGSFGIHVHHVSKPYLIVGGRAGWTQIEPDPEHAATLITPPNGFTVYSFALGNAKLYDITAFVRAVRRGLLWDQAHGFVQFGTGVYFLDFEALYEVGHNMFGPMFPPDTIEAFLIQDSSTGVGTSVGAGFSLDLSDESQFDVYPNFHFVFENGETTRFFSITFAFRLALASILEDL